MPKNRKIEFVFFGTGYVDYEGWAPDVGGARLATGGHLLEMTEATQQLKMYETIQFLKLNKDIEIFIHNPKLGRAIDLASGKIDDLEHMKSCALNHIANNNEWKHMIDVIRKK